MSLILDALRKAKSLAGGSAPQRAPAFLKSFGFEGEKAEPKKSKKILTTYVLPIVIISTVLASGVIVYIRWTGASSMEEQAQLLEAGNLLLPGNDDVSALNDLEVDIAPQETAAVESTDAIAAGTEPEAESEIPSDVETAVTSPEPPIPNTAEEIPLPPPVPEPVVSELAPPAETEPPSLEERPNDGAFTELVETAPQPAVGVGTVEETSPDETPVESAAEAPPEPSDLQINSSAGDPFELALFYHQSGDYLRALEYYNQMLDQNPMNKSVHNNLGLMYMSMANNPEAIRSFNTAIRIDPRYDKAYNNLGTVLMEDGQDAGATRAFERALELNPQNGVAMTNLASLSRRAGDIEEAKFQYLSALQVQPSSAETHYNLAVLYEEESENASAVEHYRLFLELGANRFPDFVEPVEQKIQDLSFQQNSSPQAVP